MLGTKLTTLLFHVQEDYKHLMAILSSVLQLLLLVETDRSFKKLQHRLKHTCKPKKKPTKLRNMLPRESLNILDIDDMFARTGLFEDRFESLYKIVAAAIKRPYKGKHMVIFQLYHSLTIC